MQLSVPRMPGITFVKKSLGTPSCRIRGLSREVMQTLLVSLLAVLNSTVLVEFHLLYGVVIAGQPQPRPRHNLVTI